MKQRIIYLVLVMFFVSANLIAGTNGGVSGVVKDNEGKALTGATIRIIGTTKGGFSKKDGVFEIQNIPAGNYGLKVTFTGLEPYERNITIGADQTTNVGVVKLKATKAKETKDVEVFANKYIQDAKAVAIVEKVDGTTMDNTAGKNNVQQFALTGAGVLSSGGGLIFRGSRASDSKILIDGQDISDQINGGSGSAATATGDLKYAPTASKAATADQTAIRGGAGVEFGQLTGGVLNQTVKTGRTDRYEGFLGYRTDVPSLWGKAKNGLKALGTLENTFDFGLGGPVPGLDGTTFFLSLKYYNDKFRTLNSTNYLGSGIDAKDKAGNSLGQLPNTSSEVRNITGRLPVKITNDIRLQVGASWGLTSLTTGGWGWLYADTPARSFVKNAQTGLNDTVQYSTVPISQAHQTVLNNFIYSYYLRLNHSLSETSYYEATLSYNNNVTEDSRRVVPLGDGSLVQNGVFKDPSKVSTTLPGANFFKGFETVTPKDDYVLSASGDKYELKKDPNGQGDKVLDNYGPLSGTVYLDNDPKRPFTAVVPNNLTGYVEDNVDRTSTKNPYGLTNIFNSAGDADNGLEYRSASFVQFKGNYENKIIVGDVAHKLQTGVDIRNYTVRRYNNGNPYLGNPFYDVYDSQYGGDIYSQTQQERDAGSVPKKATIGSVYISDQIQYKGINFTPGIRFDAFDPKTSFAVDPTSLQSARADATFKFQTSPRLFISYPISETSFFTIQYGIYTQVPVFSSLYNNITSVITRGNVIISNPNLQPERTNQYNVAYNTQLSDNFGFDVSLFYKDIYSLTGIAYVPNTRTPYTIIENGEYGNVRGAEFSFRRRLANNFDFTLNYTLQYASGTSSGVGTNYNLIIAGNDPFTGQKTFPLVESPLTYDRRHRINFNGGFTFGSGEGPSIGGLKILQNSNINFTALYQTGQPFTLLDLKGNQIGDYNAERHPSLTNVDCHLGRHIFLKDILGDSFGNSEIELYVDIVNIFNRVEAINLFDRTKDPDNDGVSLYKQPGEFPSGPWYAKADANVARSIDATQYDRQGNRFYNAGADANSDGLVTQYEQYQSYLNYVNDATKRKGNYQYPRQVYFGVNIRF